jgi:ABC-type multidrug transport system ATPase subunit
MFIGKTTLLNLLSGRVNAGVKYGNIYANDVPYKGMTISNSIADNMSPTYAYVMQDDVHCPFFTVRETLEFAAMLRMRVVDAYNVDNDVNETLNILGLTAVAESYVGVVGDSMLSRGQIRRLTIGVEIVNSPSMIFLDEPTTGLDSYLALSVVKSLRALAKSGRTLMCTIHSPSPALFAKFDKLLLLSQVL